jgi:hypothetical protein
MLSKHGRSIGVTLALSAVLLGSACSKAETGSTPAGTQAQGTTAAPTTTAAGKVHSDKAAFIAALKASTKDLKSAHTTMEMTGQGQEITVEGDTRLGDDPAGAFTMGMAGMNLEVVMVDKKVYVKGIPGQDPAKWASLDENSAMGKELASSMDQLDPNLMYADFEKALTDVKHVGTETVGGESMAKYELTMDTKSIPDLPTEGAQLPETLTYTTWLDDQDRMRKVTFEIAGMTAVVTMDKFDEPVDITAPPADQTFEANL